jgi:hypothetical protein
MHVLENCIRNELDVTANRAFAVLKPLKARSNTPPTHVELLLLLPKPAPGGCAWATCGAKC